MNTAKHTNLTRVRIEAYVVARPGGRDILCHFQFEE